MISPRISRIGRALSAPLLTLAILLAVYAVFGLYPFGAGSIAWCDMNQQVVPLLAEFRSVLLGDASFFRSPGAGGINFWGIFFFFLSSPFSFLSVLVKADELPWLMNWILAGKMMVSAGTAALLFRSLSDSRRSIPPVLGGVLYAFCGYTLYYYQNIVWLDMEALFPLLILSLIHLEKKKRVLPFVVVFSAMLIVHYYLSYMVVLFLLFGMALFFYLQGPSVRQGQAAMLLCCGAILSVLITAVVWLPSLLEVLRSARGEGLVKQMAQGSLETQLETTLPSVFTGAIFFGALPFLRQKQMKSSVFSAMLGMFALFCVPLLLEPVNKMWHTGSYQGFPTRYSYMISLLALLLAFFLIRQNAPREIPKRSSRAALLILAIGILAYGFLCVFMLQNELTTLSRYSKTLWGDSDSLALLAVMLLAGAAAFFLAVLCWKKKLLSRRSFAGVLGILVIIESFFNASVYLGNTPVSQQVFQYTMELDDALPQDGFYRVKAERKYFDVNLLSAMGYESLAHYTSLTPATTLSTQRRLGYSGYWMELGANGGTAFSDAVLANRYEIVPTASLTGEEQTAFRGSRLSAVELPFSLPDAILTGTAPGFLPELPAGSRMELQQALAEALFPGSEPLFTLCQPDAIENLTISDGAYYPEKKPAVLHWTVSAEEPVLLYFDCAAAPSNALVESVNDSCTIQVNGKEVEDSYPTKSNNGILLLGRFEAETVEVEVTLQKDIDPESFELFTLSEQALEVLCQSASGAEIEGSGSRFTVSCQTETEQTLFLPLSFDEGWTATVNGKPAELFRTAGNYLSLRLEAGENEVVLRYRPPGFAAGLGISLLGLGLAFLFVRFAEKRLIRARAVCRTASVVYAVAAAGVFVVIYFVPIFIWFLFE